MKIDISLYHISRKMSMISRRCGTFFVKNRHHTDKPLTKVFDRPFFKKVAGQGQRPCRLRRGESSPTAFLVLFGPLCSKRTETVFSHNIPTKKNGNGLLNIRSEQSNSVGEEYLQANPSSRTRSDRWMFGDTDRKLFSCGRIISSPTDFNKKGNYLKVTPFVLCVEEILSVLFLGYVAARKRTKKNGVIRGLPRTPRPFLKKGRSKTFIL